MAMKLSTTLSHITTVPSSSNSKIISEFYQYLKGIGTSENYQNQNLKAIIGYAKFLGPDIAFYDIQKREQIVTFLDTKIKSIITNSIKNRIPPILQENIEKKYPDWHSHLKKYNIISD